MMADSGLEAVPSRSATRWHARSDGQAFRRDHRDTDHGNFREGLTVLQYFISTMVPEKDGRYRPEDSECWIPHATARGCRPDVVIGDHDCGTMDGIEVASLVEAGKSLSR